MHRYVALLRAVNVGGTGKLPMANLRAMGTDLGFENVKTYIASGNVVFSSSLGTETVKDALEEKLEAYAGKPVGVMIRTADELRKVLEGNPFADKPGNRTVAVLLPGHVPANALENVSGRADEEIVPGKREIYLHYPGGMGQSKLKLAAAKAGTVRNMNTIAKLVEMSAGLAAG